MLYRSQLTQAEPKHVLSITVLVTMTRDRQMETRDEMTFRAKCLSRLSILL